MFGSKLRSWMENHIVRPRKKGTKVKAPSSVAVSANGLGCGHETRNKKSSSVALTINHYGNGSAPQSQLQSQLQSQSHCANHNGCCSSISSPVRRREVSPIQGHTPSRYGWQSPDKEDVITPKSDNFLYAPQHHRVRSNNQQHHYILPDAKAISCDDQLTPSGHTDRQNQHHLHPGSMHANVKTRQPSQPSQNQTDCSSSSISSLSWSTGSKEPSVHSNINSSHSSQLKTATEVQRTSFTELSHFEEDPDGVHYEEVYTILRHPEKTLKKATIVHERPKSEQLTAYAHAQPMVSNNNETQDDASTRYGRLLPSKFANYNDSIVAQGREHGSIGSGSVEYVCSNLNHSNSFHLNDKILGPMNEVVTNVTTLGRRYSNERIPNGNGQGKSAVAMHSLSSPESAYSTGYSTDGTSPGGIYTPPEYYINMRSGTHYFPKSANSLAIGTQRYKFGLNKIEEMSPIEPVPKVSFNNISGLYQRPDASAINSSRNQPLSEQLELSAPSHFASVNIVNKGTLTLTNANPCPVFKGIESPSPRQRCRIRTNPWYSTSDTISLVESSSVAAKQLPNELHPATPASTLCVSLFTCATDEKFPTKGKSTIKAVVEDIGNGEQGDSSGSSSSLTEVEMMHTPNTMRRKRAEVVEQALQKSAKGFEMKSADFVTPNITLSIGCEANNCRELHISDDDTTLNEMMGKFDESYVYEKETDILSSDSDPTECPSDLDTGQDAEDECETDDLLDIDFIDTSSIQEFHEHIDAESNLGNCFYDHSPKPSPKVAARAAHYSCSLRAFSRGENGKISSGGSGHTQHRRKRFMKTRKKSIENRDIHSPPRKPRQSRSVGGTPVCLRKKQICPKKRIANNTPLFNRSSSLGFVNGQENCSFMAIAESEKALLKADIEADVKYRQLILEAESLLVSMKSSLQSIPRTPIASPRRVNPLANKRVEMLKSCENEPLRDKTRNKTATPLRSGDGVTAIGSNVEQDLAAAINRRIEKLRSESASAPNSPKIGRCSPRKTHLTNFINQNVLVNMQLRHKIAVENSVINIQANEQLQWSRSPPFKLNGHHLQQASCASPLSSRKYAKKVNATQEAEFDVAMDNSIPNIMNKRESYLPEFERITLYDDHVEKANSPRSLERRTSTHTGICPQSEPLKRKVYKGSSSFERIKRNIDLESEIPKHSLVRKVQSVRERDYSNNVHNTNCRESIDETFSEDTMKKQMILHTIADLKRNLENQSFELNGLNED